MIHTIQRDTRGNTLYPDSLHLMSVTGLAILVPIFLKQSVKYEFFCALSINQAQWEMPNSNSTCTRSLNWNSRDILWVLELRGSHRPFRKLVEDWNAGNVPLVVDVRAQNNTVDYTTVNMLLLAWRALFLPSSLSQY
jgi:hypothetical protein